MTTLITKEQLKRVLPQTLKGNLNDETIEMINSTLSDPLMYETYRDNLMSYTHVMKEGRFKMKDYVEAVKYVSHKLMGATNIEAYTKTHPDRFQRMVDEKYSDRAISSYVSAYNKTKLVNLIMAQSLIPSHVLNQDLYQRALNTQAELMVSAQSEKVRSDAADSLLNHLRPPEVKKIELDVGMKETSSIQELQEASRKLAEQYREMIEAKTINAEIAAHDRSIIEAQDVVMKEVEDNA